MGCYELFAKSRFANTPYTEIIQNATAFESFDPVAHFLEFRYSIVAIDENALRCVCRRRE